MKNLIRSGYIVTLGFTLLLSPLVRAQADSHPESAHGIPTDEWVIELGSHQDPRSVAAAIGAELLGPVGAIPNTYLFRMAEEDLQKAGYEARARARIAGSGKFRLVEQQVARQYFPRAEAVSEDPLVRQQWHHENLGQRGGTAREDANVLEAWKLGYSGAGITIAVVDEGTEVAHPDLAPNYQFGTGLDINDNDNDPSPEAADESHGTAVSGVSVAASNGIDGAGVAHASLLVPIRILAAPITGAEGAEAMTHRLQYVDVYNNSWGPSDDLLVFFGGPSGTFLNALRTGVQTGRGGRGAIYVWAAGNGALSDDNANYDGFVNSRYTVAVGAVGADGRAASYSEPGACLLVVAPSQGAGPGILTTDQTGTAGYSPNNTTFSFNGTSAAAPLVSGVVALMLEANPNLGWRDVQQILAKSAVKNDPTHPDWSRNGAGYNINHRYGFGRVDAAGAVKLAENWVNVGPELSYNSGLQSLNWGLNLNQMREASVVVSDSIKIQHVDVTVSANSTNWGGLEIVLVSPEGTESRLAEPHTHLSDGTTVWTFNSLRHLDETSAGTWRLRITDRDAGGTPTVNSWSLSIYGESALTSKNRAPLADDLDIVATQFPLVLNAVNSATDPDGDGLSLLSVKKGAGSTTSYQANGEITYAGGEGFRGSDVIGYTLSDGKGGTVHRTIVITSPLPTAANDSVATVADRDVLFDALDNDFDLQGDPISLVSVGQPRSGTLDLIGDSFRYVPQPGFVGWDRFSYLITDGTDGQDEGWVTVSVTDKPDFALQFDGLNSRAVAPAEEGIQFGNTFTVEAWIKPESYGEYVTGFGRIIDKGPLAFFINGFGHPFYHDQSMVLYYEDTTGAAIAANTASGAIKLGEWQHVAVTVDLSLSNPVRFYLNGQALSTVYPAEVGQPVAGRTLANNRFDDLYIGEAETLERAFYGAIADVRAWKVVRNSAQIVGGKDLALSGAELGLMANWQFNEGYGPILGDIGLAAAHATIVDADWTTRVLPWQSVLDYFDGPVDNGDGWFEDRTFGWLYADFFNDVYHPNLGWLIAAGSGGNDDFWFYSGRAGLGWLYTTRELYPWFYSLDQAAWLFYQQSSPGWFFNADPLVQEWILFE